MADETLKKAAEILKTIKESQSSSKAQTEKERRDLILGASKDIAAILKPSLDEIAQQGKVTRQDLLDAVANITVTTNTPDVNIPEIKVPQANITVRPATVNIPDIKMPDKMNVEGWVRLMGVNLENPLPVQLRDAKGNPLNLFENLTTLVTGGQGGGFRRVRVDNPSTEPVNVAIVSGAGATSAVNLSDSSGVGYSGSNPLPVTITAGAGATSAANIVDSTGVAFEGANPFPITGTIVGITNSVAVSIIDSGGVEYSGSNPVPVVFGAAATQGVMMVDSNAIAYSGSNPVPVVFGAAATQAVMIVDSTGIAYGGSNPMDVDGTVVVSGVTNSIAVTILDAEGLYREVFPIEGTVTGITNSVAVSLIDSGGVQYSGVNPVPITGTVTGITNSVAVSIVDSAGVAFGGANPMDIDGTVVVSGITNSVAVSIIDPAGVQFSGANPLTVVLATNAANSTVIVGPVVSDAADDGSAPVKIGGIARTANPTAVAAGDTVSSSHDDVGRILNRPIQVRDLLATASITVTTNNADRTQLIAGVAGTYFDLIQMIGANASDGAVSVWLMDCFGGTAVAQLEIPANGTAGFVSQVPIPQHEASNSWYVDWDANTKIADRRDVTNTNVKITALFTKEV